MNTQIELTSTPTNSVRIKNAQSLLLLKALMLLILSVAAYLGALRADTYWVGAICIAAVAFCVVAIAANVSHDAVHGAFSSVPWRNELALWSLDAFGVNAALWRARHLQHHRFPNLIGVDPDLETGNLLRLQPAAQLLKMHQWQSIYAWLVYSLSMIKLQLFDDIEFIGRGFVANRDLRKERGKLVVRSIAGKLILFVWAIAIPLQYHSAGNVLLGFVFGWMIVALAISILFQVAHCVEGAVYSEQWPTTDEGRRRAQISHTANFRIANPFIDFVSGGLNRQIEHHLSPRLPHLLLRDRSHLSEAETALVERRTFSSLWQAIKSHQNLLKMFGQSGISS